LDLREGRNTTKGVCHFLVFLSDLYSLEDEVTVFLGNFGTLLSSEPRHIPE